MKRYILVFWTALFPAIFGRAAAAASASPASPDSLSVYIASALSASPAVQAAYRAYESQTAGACGAGVLNDPELSVNLYPKAMQHVNVKQIATFSLMQMFPWPGSLKAGRQQMEFKAIAAYQQYRQTAIELAFNLEKQWYTILATQEKIRAVEAKLKLLRDIKQVALLQYKSPVSMKNARMSDQLRFEAEEERLLQQKGTLDDLRALQRQQFNLLMHRSADAPLCLPDTLVKRQMPLVNLADIEHADPVLLRLLADNKALDAQDQKARLMGMPMVGVGVQYMLNGKVDHPMMDDMNGNDMLMPMLKVTLPIYRRKISAARRSAQLQKESNQFSYQSRLDAIRAQQLSIEQRAADVDRRLALYDREEQILARTLALMQTEYANGSTMLTDILQTTRDNIDYDLRRAEARAEYNTLVAEMERLAALLSPETADRDSHHHGLPAAPAAPALPTAPALSTSRPAAPAAPASSVSNLK